MSTGGFRARHTRTRMRSLLSRATLALVSLLLIGWFAVLVRDEHIGAEATDRLLHNPEMSDSRFARSLEELRQAEFLNPDTEWRVTRASYILLRDKPRAVRVVESVLRKEPENLSAWVVLLNASRDRDPRRASRAVDGIRRLNPPLDGR